MFDVCGLWAAKLIMGEISLPIKEEMKRYLIAYILLLFLLLHPAQRELTNGN